MKLFKQVIATLVAVAIFCHGTLPSGLSILCFESNGTVHLEIPGNDNCDSDDHGLEDNTCNDCNDSVVQVNEGRAENKITNIQFAKLADKACDLLVEAAYIAPEVGDESRARAPTRIHLKTVILLI